MGRAFPVPEKAGGPGCSLTPHFLGRDCIFLAPLPAGQALGCSSDER